MALLAGLGQERALREPRLRRHLLLLVPGAILLGFALALPAHPTLVSSVFSRWMPQLAEPLTLRSALALWPALWMTVGCLAMAAAAAMFLGSGWARLAGVVAVLDLLVVNGALNRLTSPRFYELEPDVKAMVREAAAQGTFRWFCYGASNTPGIRWEPAVVASGSDLWLYHADRQSLLPRTAALDGLESALDADGAGWAPEGSTLPASEITPAFYRKHHARIRLANVRWVTSFVPLPSDLVAPRAEARLAEIRDPLVLYELRDPLPRVFWVPRHEVVADRAALGARLESPGFDPGRPCFSPPSRPRAARPRPGPKPRP